LPQKQFAVDQSKHGPHVVQELISNGKQSVLWAEGELLVQMAGFNALHSDKLKFKYNVVINDV
jgi:hypothetical protein